MKKIIIWILVLAWMGVIFYFSSMDSTTSTNKSRGIITSTKIIEKYESDKTPEESEELLESTDVVFRKIAHACEFLVLGILVCFLIKEYTLDIKKILIIAAIICFLYACSDEIHQIYVPGRSCEIRDIIIDNKGALVGYVIFYVSGLKIWKKA